MKRLVLLCRITAAAFTVALPARAAVTQQRYYAHNAVEDAHGVIAPWYHGSNGQVDERVRVAAETLRRYPWSPAGKGPRELPEYMYSGAWRIDAKGKITIPPLSDWANGDLGQRAGCVLCSLIDYYRYSGEAWALAHISLQADALLDYCLTPEDHPWPRFLISVPTRGRPYGQADPHGFIQLDIVAEVGIQMVRAAQLCGNERWMEAARHWGDLLAERRLRETGVNPWPRYANPQDAPWEDVATGGVASVLEFFDELIAAGYPGRNNEIVQARQAGVSYLRDVLLPDWLGHETWGRQYWDWPCPVQVENVTEFVARYLMNHPDEFPNWRTDARNVLTLFINRTGAARGSAGDVFSGAWAYPESSGCCGRSLWYAPFELAFVYGQYGVLTGSEWAREMGRRQLILATYDFHPTGVVEDGIDGGPVVAGDWFKIAHPMALRHALAGMAWQPDLFGPPRENHIMRAAGVVTQCGRGGYTVVVPRGPARPLVDVLRLAFEPTAIAADGEPLAARRDLDANGYVLKPLDGGDWLVTIRHDGRSRITYAGPDPERVIDAASLEFAGLWSRATFADLERDRQPFVSAEPGAEVNCRFEGTRVRVLGVPNEHGGLADVYLDGEKQLAGVDCFAPVLPATQVLFTRGGLKPGSHTIRLVVRGEKNPASSGADVAVCGIACSSADTKVPPTWGAGGGPKDAQRWIFGYPGRVDYLDSVGHPWRPATEWVIRSGDGVDTVAAAWYSRRRQLAVQGTADPEIYRYGAHGREFWADFTVGPGTYHARLRFLETRNLEPKLRAQTILINGREMVAGLDVAATAARAAGFSSTQPYRPEYSSALPGMGRAVDLVFDGLQPRNGVISILFRGTFGGEAIVQAIEVGPGPGGPGAEPVSYVPPVASGPSVPDGDLLVNGGFEQGGPKDLGFMGKTGSAAGWSYTFAGPSMSYIWLESDYAAHPDWGLPVYHAGRQALRTHTNGSGHTAIYQDVVAEGRTAYEASVWVRTEDLHGRGFGMNGTDSAGLWIQEFDKAGNLVVSHPKQAVSVRTEYRHLELRFTTSVATTRIRFILDTVLAGAYDQGHVTYDDALLLRAKSQGKESQ